MTTTMYICTILTIAFISYIYGTTRNTNPTQLENENKKLTQAFETHLTNIDHTTNWMKQQFHHSNMFNIAIQNMRDVTIRHQRGELTTDEAEMEYELYRAEGQVHFDALEEETRKWYAAELEEMGVGHYLKTRQ